MENNPSFGTKEKEGIETAVTIMLAEALARQIANQVIESIKRAG